MTEYNQGGVINPHGDNPVPVTLQLGERAITHDQTVYELQPCDGGMRWVEIGTGIRLWMEGR